MKILVVHSNNGTLSVTPMADSTTLRSGQPFFVPDFAPHYAVEPMLALRIGRLGKCIAQRFAHRYIDAATATFVVRPLNADMQPDTLNGMAAALDGSVLMGKWTPLAEGAQLPSVQWTHNGEEHTLDGNTVVPSMQEAVSFLSQYCTLKMGDIVCLTASQPHLQPVAIGDRVTANIGDTQVLRNNIK